MTRGQIAALLTVALLAAFVIYLSVRGRQPPVMPADEDHAVFIRAESCMSCHSLDGESTQEKNHPLRRDCLDCHGRP
jgi:hypothetical protein